jgi:hypothetical protein
MIPLTTMHSSELDAAIRRTFPGQAHWAGYNAPDERCGSCRHFTAKRKNSATAFCAEDFRRRNGKKVGPIPESAWACQCWAAWDGESERILPSKKTIPPVVVLIEVPISRKVG